MKTDGQHVIADIWLNESQTMGVIIDAAKGALKKGGMTVVGEARHEFGGEAVTAVWILAESHFSLHYFPERLYIALDCFTCGDEGQPLVSVASMCESIGAASADIRLLKRGG